MNKQQFTILISLLVVIFGILFYWYAVRPSEIRKKCFNDIITFDKMAYPDLFGDTLAQQEAKDIKSCLMEHGLAE
jgi:hypothetical protein